MYDIVALGELLIDFTESGRSTNGMKLFEQNPGGAVANVLAAAAKCGRKTAFIGKVGTDMHGLFLKRTLEAAGIETTGLVLAEDVFTTLAFVALSPEGERAFSFARKPGADTQLRGEEIDPGLLSATRVLHVGSLSLTDEPAKSATYSALETAKKGGAMISYDPNYRASLWPTESIAKDRMRSIIPYADVMKLSDSETGLLTDEAEPEAAALALQEKGVACVAVTLGGKGALVCVENRTAYVAGYSVPVVDTTGAGDAFWGGFLHKLLESGKHPGELSIKEACACAAWGNATAALCIQKRGAMPAMPHPAQVRELLLATD
ncbi:MAG: carbohydrate kinase [Candidatus Pelethousia sp.]|nr:carbohydrate kinase [Candidatus Pelethousia sp.]